MNLVKLSDKQLERFGEKTAIIFEGEEFTNMRLNKMGRRLAAGLKSLGIGRGDHVVESIESHRPYRPGLGLDKALEEISKNRGILYDEDVVDACLRLFKEKNFQYQ